VQRGMLVGVSSANAAPALPSASAAADFGRRDFGAQKDNLVGIRRAGGVRI
jgi:hypothetical protein